MFLGSHHSPDKSLNTNNDWQDKTLSSVIKAQDLMRDLNVENGNTLLEKDVDI